MAQTAAVHDNAFLAPLTGALPVLSAANGSGTHAWHMRTGAAPAPAADPAAQPSKAVAHASADTAGDAKTPQTGAAAGVGAAASANPTAGAATGTAKAVGLAAAAGAAAADGDAGAQDAGGAEFALIILTAATQAQSLFPHLWSGARVRICADGGSSRLYERVPPQLRDQYIPHVICGDFDSAQQPVLSFYQQHGAELQHIVDDNCTDLEKCLTLLKQRQALPRWRVSTVVVYGAFGGRFDHVIACIQTLYKFNGAFERLVLFGEDNLAQLLPPGKHVIRCHPRIEPPAAAPAHGADAKAAATGADAAGSKAAAAAVAAPREPVACGLLPIGGAARHVTSSGLKWNVSDQTLQFGGLVSTSNIIADATVTIHTADPLVWTTSPLTTAF